MTGWTELTRLGATVRPLSDKTIKHGNHYSPFSAGLSSTMQTLSSELRHLGAKNIIVGLDVQDRMIRQDGMPRADARLDSAAVEIAFESKYGPLRYATAEYHTWQANLRAIALSMEALRKVDRYGVSKRGEQYAGWRQITAGDDAHGLHDRATAQRWIEDTYETLNHAIKATHPDIGGDREMFLKVMRAKKLIEA